MGDCDDHCYGIIETVHDQIWKLTKHQEAMPSVEARVSLRIICNAIHSMTNFVIEGRRSIATAFEIPIERIKCILFGFPMPNYFSHRLSADWLVVGARLPKE